MNFWTFSELFDAPQVSFTFQDLFVKMYNIHIGAVYWLAGFSSAGGTSGTELYNNKVIKNDGK